MNPTLDDLRMAAYRAGFEIKTDDLGDDLGQTDSTLRIIWLAEGLTGRALRSTLAHETVHAQLGHSGPRQLSGEDVWRGREEHWLDAAVDVLAAGRLFSEQDFLSAIADVGHGSYEAVARRLGVDRQMLRAWHNARKAARGDVAWLRDRPVTA